MNNPNEMKIGARIIIICMCVVCLLDTGTLGLQSFNDSTRRW